jgi:thymidylate synthase
MTVYSFSNDNPSQIYVDALFTLLEEGKELSPRGKKIYEIRPIMTQFTDPTNRVTFNPGRTVNPFFQLAESFWILSGRSDVEWLLTYNRNMGQFSDNGKHFNAPYGERLRYWNKNDANEFIYNPIDQLYDAYMKIRNDLDTRQAYTTIYNPEFDNGSVETVDRPCNLGIDFKVRDNKLDVMVPNRSNDLHWGMFGANLAQFTTIQEFMASALGVEIGTYTVASNSLHIYVDEYGSKITDMMLNPYGLTRENIRNGMGKLSRPAVQQFKFEYEPRMSVGFHEFTDLSNYYFNELEPFVDECIKSDDLEMAISRVEEVGDRYFHMTFKLMMAYRIHKKRDVAQLAYVMSSVKDSSWKVSCLRFLWKHYKDEITFRELYTHLSPEIVDYIEHKGE